MKYSTVTVSELLKLDNANDFWVSIDPIDFYKILRSSGYSKSKATARVTQNWSRVNLHRKINSASHCRRQIQKSVVDSYITTNLDMHKYYIKTAKTERKYFVARLPR